MTTSDTQHNDLTNKLALGRYLFPPHGLRMGDNFQIQRCGETVILSLVQGMKAAASTLLH